MPGLVPGIHACGQARPVWMARPHPAEVWFEQLFEGATARRRPRPAV